MFLLVVSGPILLELVALASLQQQLILLIELGLLVLNQLLQLSKFQILVSNDICIVLLLLSLALKSLSFVLPLRKHLLMLRFLLSQLVLQVLICLSDLLFLSQQILNLLSFVTVKPLLNPLGSHFFLSLSIFPPCLPVLLCLVLQVKQFFLLPHKHIIGLLQASSLHSHEFNLDFTFFNLLLQLFLFLDRLLQSVIIEPNLLERFQIGVQLARRFSFGLN